MMKMKLMEASANSRPSTIRPPDFQLFQSELEQLRSENAQLRSKLSQKCEIIEQLKTLTLLEKSEKLKI